MESYEFIQKKFSSTLDRAAQWVFPLYKGRITPLNPARFLAAQINSSLSLQVILSFNLYLFPVWFIGMISVLSWKIDSFQLDIFHHALMVALASIFIVLEPVRIFMGFTGNLKERVPDLCGSFMLSTFPQLPILLYFCGLQSLTASGFTLPFEFALNFVYALVLIPQILIGYRAAKHIVDIQAARFVVGVGELRSGFDDIALAAEPDHGKAKAE